MLRCNLAVLMAERKLKITKISNDTGISRATLTAISNNNGQGIQFNTLNSLCNYLNVTPGQFFSYVPIDIEVKNAYLDSDNFFIINLSIKENGRACECDIGANVYPKYVTRGDISTNIYDYNDNDEGSLSYIEIDIGLFEDSEEEWLREKAIIIHAFKSLSVSFLNDIQEEITQNILSEYDNVLDNCGVDFTWPDEFK